MALTEAPSAADALVRAAHDAGYRFPPGFPGFRATLTFARAGVRGSGTVVFAAGARPQIDIDLPEEDERWLEHELGSLAGHRFHRAYEDADGPLDKDLRENDGHPLGPLVALDDPLDSTYRIADGRISEISRTHGGVRFTILIQERLDTGDGRSLSSAFTVFHWELGTRRLLRTDAYSDRHVEWRGVIVPARRRVATATDAGLVVRELVLGEHGLLPRKESS